MVPVAASLLYVRLPQDAAHDASMAALMWLLWWCWFYMGPRAVWAAWHGKVSTSNLRIRPHSVTGHRGWPIRRLRSVHLDHLNRVHYRRSFWPSVQPWSLKIQSYIYIEDQAGNRILIEFDSESSLDNPTGQPMDRIIKHPNRYRYPRLRRTLLEALERTPSARADILTRRRLNGQWTEDAVWLGTVRGVLTFISAVALALGVVVTLWRLAS